MKIMAHMHHMYIIARIYKVFENGELMSIGKLHHLIMYSGFIISGIMDIASLFITSQRFLSLAFRNEFLLWYFHTHGRDLLNIQVHWILMILSFSLRSFLSLVHVTADKPSDQHWLGK